MTDTPNRTDRNIISLPICYPETAKPQLVDAILETPDGPVIIGTGFKTLQEASDAVARWSAPEHIEAKARELHRNYRALDWITWEQLSKECKDEFRRDARRKLEMGP